MRNDALMVRRVNVGRRARGGDHVFRFTRRPTGFILGDGTNHDEMVFLAIVAPEVADAFEVGLFVFARRMQPNDQPVGNIGVVVLGNVEPILVLAVGGVAFDQARIGLFFVGGALIGLGRLLFLLERFERLQRLFQRRELGQLFRNRRVLAL